MATEKIFESLQSRVPGKDGVIVYKDEKDNFYLEFFGWFKNVYGYGWWISKNYKPKMDDGVLEFYSGGATTHLNLVNPENLKKEIIGYYPP